MQLLESNFPLRRCVAPGQLGVWKVSYTRTRRIRKRFDLVSFSSKNDRGLQEHWSALGSKSNAASKSRSQLQRIYSAGKVMASVPRIEKHKNTEVNQSISVISHTLRIKLLVSQELGIPYLIWE